MKKETRIYITYLFPGSFVPEEATRQVKNTDIPKTIPRDCFAFRFHETEFVIDGKKEFVGKSKDLSKTYVVGEAIPLAKLPKDEAHAILRSNIEHNSPTKTAIKTHLGNWQMEDANHVAIPVSKFTLGDPMYYKAGAK